MNWVGGVRQRMKQKNDRKIQREYFERQRKQAKISKIKSESAEKENCTNKAISQDLLFLYPLPGREYSDPSSLPCKRPVNFIDLSKRKPSRIRHHVALGPDCLDRFPKSKLEFHGAGDEREQLRNKKSGTVTKTGENPETPMPRSILDKQIADAERRSKPQSQSTDTKRKESKIHFDNPNIMRSVTSSGWEMLNVTDKTYKTNSTTNRGEAATKPVKRYFPQKLDMSLQEKPHLFDNGNLEKNISKEYSVIERSSHNANKAHEEYDRFFRNEQSQLVPGLNQKSLESSKENQLLVDWVNKICPRKEVPFIEKQDYRTDAWQKRLDVASISEVAEKKTVFSIQPQKQFPSNSSKILNQSRATAHLHQRGAWNSADLSGESSGHTKTRFSDINSKTPFADYTHSSEIVNNFGNRLELPNQPWGNKKYSSIHYQSSVTETKSSVIVSDCKNEFEHSLPTFPNGVPCDHQVDALKSDQQCFQSLDFPLDKFSNFNDDSEEDRFRQAIFKQRPSQQLALDVKSINNLDFEDEVPHVSQTIGQADVTNMKLEMPQSVPEAYAEVMEMEDETISDDQRSSAGDNQVPSDLDPSMDNKEARSKVTSLSGAWEEKSYHSPLEANNKRSSITLASLGPSADDEHESCQQIQCISFGCSPNCKVTQTSPEDVAFPNFKSDLVSSGNAEGGDITRSLMQTISTEVQTEDLLCQNCGCSVCDILGEINASYPNELVKQPAELSAAVLEADARIRLEDSPDLLDGSRNEESAQIAEDDGNQDLMPHRSISLTKNVIIGVAYMDMERNKKLSPSTESNGRKRLTRSLKCKEDRCNLTCNIEDVVGSDKSDTSPAGSPCVIQTRSKTAKRVRAK